MIIHIFFDLDHTLWDFEANSKATLLELSEEFLAEKKITLEDFFPVYKEINAGLWKKWSMNAIDQATLRVSRFSLTLEALQKPDPSLAEILSHEYLKRSPFKTQLMPGAIEILDYLAPKYPLHLITNGFKDAAEAKLSSTPLGNYFQEVIVSEVFGVQKPHVSIFEHALQKANASVENAWMIGDNLDADVRGPIKAGWKAIYYNHFQQPKPDDVPLEIHHLLELKNFF
jgi:putative hydrolase of the HAD superfamily